MQGNILIKIKNYYYNFSVEQLLHLNSILISIGEGYSDIKHTIMNVLSRRKSKVADLFFSQQFCSFENDIIQYAFQYFNIVGIERFLKQLSRDIIKLESIRFKNIFKWIFHFSPNKYFIQFINYEPLIIVSLAIRIYQIAFFNAILYYSSPSFPGILF